MNSHAWVAAAVALGMGASCVALPAPASLNEFAQPTRSPGATSLPAIAPLPVATQGQSTPLPQVSTTPEALGIDGVLDAGGAIAVDNGIPGDLITLKGSGFGLAPTASYSVTVGGMLIPTYHQFVRDSGRLLVILPLGFTRGTVAVALGSATVESSQVLTAIASLSLAPLDVTLAPGEKRQFSVDAFDVDGNPIAQPNVLWGMRNERCIGTGCEDNDAAKVQRGLAVGELDVGDILINRDGTRQRVSPPGALVAVGEIFVGNLNVIATGSIRIRIPT